MRRNDIRFFRWALLLSFLLLGPSAGWAGEVFRVANLDTGPPFPFEGLVVTVGRDRVSLAGGVAEGWDSTGPWLYDPDTRTFTPSPLLPDVVVAWRGELLLGLSGVPAVRRLCKTTAEGRALQCFYYGSVTHIVPLSEHALFLSPTGDEGELRLGTTDGTREGTALLPTPLLRSSTLTTLGEAVLFLAGDGEVALWRSDGSATGTRRLAALPPAAGSGWSPVVAGRLAFFAVGRELWATDGTTAGTRRVSRSLASGVTTLVPARDRVYFGGVAGRKPALFVSDGTLGGTRWVANLLRPLRAGAGLGKRLLFRGHSTGKRNELWVSDGTSRGTRLLSDVVPASSRGDIFGFASLRGRVVFLAGSRQQAVPWASDGTPGGTVPLSETEILATEWKALDPGLALACSWRGCLRTDGTPEGTGFATGVRGELAGYVGHSAVFVEAVPVDRVETLARVFVSDGTAAGTRELDIPRTDRGSDPVSLQTIGERLFFQRGRDVGALFSWNGQDDPEPIETVPFQHLASVAGRVFIAGSEGLWRVEPGPPERLSDGRTGSLVAAQSRVFATRSGESSRDLVVSDGTLAGTRRVPLSPSLGQPTPVNDDLFWLDQFPLVPDFPRYDLWKSDGTAAGTDIAVAGIVPFEATKLPAFGGEVFYVPESAPSELWASDGTAGSERRIASVGPGSYVTAVEATETGVFFLVESSGPRPSLWWSDGSPVATGPVMELPARPVGMGVSRFPLDNPLTAAGPLLVFGLDDGAHGLEPWRSDGTSEGTGLLADLCPGPCSSRPSMARWTGSRLAFAAVGGGDRGIEAWLSDGTPEGTFELPEVAPGVLSSFPADFVDLGDLLVFSADDNFTGRELWAYRP